MQYNKIKYEEYEDVIKIAAHKEKTLNEMVKYWEDKGYEKSSPLYADNSAGLRTFYWQEMKKK